jgi:hypothetical protein
MILEFREFALGSARQALSVLRTKIRMPELEVATITRGARWVVEAMDDLDAERSEVDGLLSDSRTVPSLPSRLEHCLAEFPSFLRDGEPKGFEVLLPPLANVLPGLLRERRTRR